MNLAQHRISGDLIEVLTRHFGKKSAVEIWSTAACGSPRIAFSEPYGSSTKSPGYQDSFRIPPFSRSDMTNNLRRVGNDRTACAAFMRETMMPVPSMIADGTRIISQSEGITKAMPGHGHDHCHMPQVDKIYVMSPDSGYGYPAFYRNVDGNTPDVPVMVLTMEDAGIRKAIVLGDAWFGSDGNYKELSDPRKELDYIIPLRQNTSETKLEIRHYTHPHVPLGFHAAKNIRDIQNTLADRGTLHYHEEHLRTGHKPRAKQCRVRGMVFHYPHHVYDGVLNSDPHT
jgi:hypothetical protein